MNAGRSGELNYFTAGDSGRPAVLFLHGFMGSSADWRETMEALEGRFYCVSLDLPGHGASTGLPPNAYTIEGATGRVLDVLGVLGVERPVLVGYSMGGRLALYLTLHHPEHFSGLFLESASPGLEGQEERSARREIDESRSRSLETEYFGRFLEEWYSQPLFASLARDEALLRRTIEARRRSDPAELAKSLRGMGTGSQPPLWEELPGLRVPALAVVGEVDEKFVGIGRRMEAESPMVGFAPVPEVGHNVRAEAPGAYIGLLRDFLDSL